MWSSTSMIAWYNDFRPYSPVMAYLMRGQAIITHRYSLSLEAGRLLYLLCICRHRRPTVLTPLLCPRHTRPPALGQLFRPRLMSINCPELESKILDIWQRFSPHRPPRLDVMVRRNSREFYPVDGWLPLIFQLWVDCLTCRLFLTSSSRSDQSTATSPVPWVSRILKTMWIVLPASSRRLTVANTTTWFGRPFLRHLLKVGMALASPLLSNQECFTRNNYGK